MISKNDALKAMEKLDPQGRRIPFSIAFVTADRAAWAKKKRMQRELHLLVPGTNDYDALKEKIDAVDTGGRILEGDECVLSNKRGIHSKMEVQEKKDIVAMQKNPRHWKNRTRNILFLASEQIRKCHISLIVNFNGQEVTY